MSDRSRISLRTIGRNVVSLMASDAVNRATTFVLYALVSRYLGLYQFGQLSLALTFYYVFQVLAAAGLKTLVTREVSRDRSKTGRYLANGGLLVALTSLAAVAILMVLVRLMHYSADTSLVIFVVSLGLFPYALSAICEALFQAWEEMLFIAYVNLPLNTLKVVAAFLVLHEGRGLYAILVTMLLAQYAVAVLELAVVLRRVGVGRLRVDAPFALGMVRSATTFLGIDVLIAFFASLNVILLSKLGDEREVGLYTAAGQILVPVILVYQNAALGIFPAMCRSLDAGPGSLGRIGARLIEVLLAIGLPALVALTFFAQPVLGLLYGNDEVGVASVVVAILVWELVLRAFTNGLGQVLLAGLQERSTLRIVAIDAVVALVAGLILIGRWRLIGAAVAVVLVRGVDLVQHYARVRRLIGRIGLLRAAWKPALAAGCMVAYLCLVRQRGLLEIVSAGLVYLAVLLSLTVASLGGPQQVRARYLHQRLQ